ncbi:MAG: hypothetical protein R3B45_13135 [Bdellovibrionota bacterium]
MQQTKIKAIFLIIGALLQMVAPDAFAWGERGHRIVTRVAVHLLAEKSNNDKSLVIPFQAKEYMLAHLSNIPDIYWRSLPKKMTELGNPTHFIDFEIATKKPGFSTVDLSPVIFYQNALSGCLVSSTLQDCPEVKKLKSQGMPKAIGSAPWRAFQFWREMKREFSSLILKTKKLGNRKKVEKAAGLEIENFVNKALLNAGLMSHFVGDLGNPMHTTVDYDGKNVGQPGLHRYFETDIVNAYSMSLMLEVYDDARKNRPAQSIFRSIPKKQAKVEDSAALNMILALAFNSFSRNEYLLSLDRRYAMSDFQKLDEKTNGRNFSKVKRHPPEQVKDKFKPFALERLAAAADVLSELWLLAWKEAGKPDLQEYQSYVYELKPDFIPPNYLP